MCVIPFNVTLKNTYLAILLLFVLGCEEEPLPSYVMVNEFEVQTKPDEGSASSNISDVWVLQNGVLQGVFELPAIIPLISEGPTDLAFIPGIKNNGVSGTRTIYPFYTSDDVSIDLSLTDTVTVKPVVTYSQSTVFNLIEDFEQGNNFENLIRVTEPDLVFEGVGSAMMILDTAVEITEAISNNSFTVPSLSNAVYLEVNYRNTTEFAIGLIANINGIPNRDAQERIIVAERSDWNKIYVDFTPAIQILQADDYQIVFRAISGDATDTILLDNIKFAHF